MTKRLLLLLTLVFMGACESQYYTISQKKNVAPRRVDISKYRKAAVIVRQTKRNKLFLEALNMTLMRKGLEVVEREKLFKLLDEQLLAKGDFANLSDRERAMRIGKLLDVDVIFYADAIMNNIFYVYEPPGAFGPDPQEVIKWQRDANKSGVLRGIGRTSIRAYCDVGLTLRAIDTATGEIIWVGYRVMASHQPITKRNREAQNSFSTVKNVCKQIINDFLGRNN